MSDVIPQNRRGDDAPTPRERRALLERRVLLDRMKVQIRPGSIVVLLSARGCALHRRTAIGSSV